MQRWLQCYENKECLWSYLEDEPLGAFNPYSSVGSGITVPWPVDALGLLLDELTLMSDFSRKYGALTKLFCQNIYCACISKHERIDERGLIDQGLSRDSSGNDKAYVRGYI
jgi:hypothetical protein